MADSEEMKTCNNCKRQISTSNFIMHEMHCKRHISLCPHCNEPIPKSEMEVHFEETHAKIKCSKCNVEVEKMHLEEHEENSCAKKPMKCVFCELEFPKSELQEHIDYCGSRTESCVKCGQFIMLREQTRHDESNCQYPETKPTNYSRSSFTVSKHRNSTDSSRNPFGFGDPAKFVGGQAKKIQPYFNKIDMPTQGNIGIAKQNNITKSLKGNGKSVLHKKIDMEMIPCEFCEEPFNADDLVQHQSGCSLGHITSMLPEMTGTSSSKQAKPNSHYREIWSPVPRNFGADEWSQDMALLGTGDVTNDDKFLPCEFCCEQYPLDVLIQHQALCESSIFTPRVRTPAETYLKQKKKSSISTTEILAADVPNFNSKRHQPPPTLFNTSPDDNGDTFLDARYNSSSTGMIPSTKPKPGATHAVPSTRYSSDTDTVPGTRYKSVAVHALGTRYHSKTNHTVQNHRPNLKAGVIKNGVSSPGQPDFYSGQRSSYRLNNSTNADLLHPNASQVSKRDSGSTAAARIQVSLNSLLNDTDGIPSSHDHLAHIGASDVKRKDTNLLPKRVPTERENFTKGAMKLPPTMSAAREQQQLASHTSRSGTSIRTNRNRSNNHIHDVRVSPDEGSEIIADSCQQTRAANGFGSSGSTKPAARKE